MNAFKKLLRAKRTKGLCHCVCLSFAAVSAGLAGPRLSSHDEKPGGREHEVLRILALKKSTKEGDGTVMRERR